jgi:transposase-like protein
LALIGREGLMGMIGVDKIGEIRRAYFEQGRTIKEIVRTLSVSRATVRKVIRGHRTEFKYERGVQPTPKLGDWVEVLTDILEKEGNLPKRERRSTQRVFEELRGRGYDGAHDSVHRFVKAWRDERARLSQADRAAPLTCSRVPNARVIVLPGDSHSRRRDSATGSATAATRPVYRRASARMGYARRQRGGLPTWAAPRTR